MQPAKPLSGTAPRIDAHLDGDTISCRLIGVPDDGQPVTWTLHRGDFNPRRASRPVTGGAELTRKLPQMDNGYAVRASVGGLTYQSDWFQYFSEETSRRYKEWRADNTGTTSRMNAIPLFRYEEPFQNIGFFCHKPDRDLSKVKWLASLNDLAFEIHEGVGGRQLTVLSNKNSSTDSAGNQFAYSGITRDFERLLLGHEDVVSHTPDVRRLRDAVGEFHLLSWDENSISFEHDYIGQGHLFYYESSDIIAAANGLHLLSLMLRTLDIELTIDAAMAKSKFFSTSYPFEFQHGTRTDFAQIRRVSAYERLVIDSNGLALEKTEMWRDTAGGDLTDAVYEDLLVEAAREITENVAIAVRDPRFENVIVELSAGLDSRIIYSALTNLPPSEKVRVSTRRGAEESVAVQINNLYDYRWDDLPRRRSYDVGSEGFPATSHSVFMDGYYIESMFKPRESYLRPTLVLTGHGGEAFSRVMSVEGYFARAFDGELPQPVENMDEVLGNVIRYIGNHQVWFEAGQKYFPDILDDAMHQSPSTEFSKRFEDLYVSERNPYVCGSVFRGAMTAPQWRPLHSKSLFRLKSLWFQYRQDYRLQYDLIRVLNPLVSEAPYIKPIELARKEEFHEYRPPFPIKEPIAFSDNAAKLKAARSQAASASVWSPSQPEFDEIRATVQSYEDSAESFLDPLRHILNVQPDFDDMGLPLYAYVQRFINRTDPKSFSKRHNIRNKLHILLQEIHITRLDPCGVPEEQAAVSGAPRTC